MSINSVSQAASYLQYLQRPQPTGQPANTAVADADHDGDVDIGGGPDHDSGHQVDIKA